MNEKEKTFVVVTKTEHFRVTGRSYTITDERLTIHGDGQEQVAVFRVSELVGVVEERSLAKVSVG